MKRIRVLIVESSSTMRQTLSRILGGHLDLEIVGAVASGRLALAKLGEVCPDVILLDIAVADREGLKTLESVRRSHPHLPVVVFSRLTERGSQTTVDALLLGANAYVTKPESNSEIECSVQDELITKLISLGSLPTAANPLSGTTDSMQPARNLVNQAPRNSPPSLLPAALALPAAVAGADRSADIVAIAASTGGPSALASVLSSLPPSFAAPIVIVQHMAAGFTSKLAESLRRQTGRNVREVLAAQPLDASTVWVAPGGRHLVVTRKQNAIQVVPNDGAPENDCCPSADVLFRSVANVFGSSCLAVVLTGMGNDGLAGCRAIRNAGGIILVQDEASSVCWGMPGQIAAAGLADAIVPLTDLSRKICQFAMSQRISP